MVMPIDPSNQPVVPPTSALQTAIPRRKVLAGGVTGAVVTSVILILNIYVFTGNNADQKIPPELASSATTVLSFLASYLVSPDPKETSVPDENGNTKSAREQ